VALKRRYRLRRREDFQRLRHEGTTLPHKTLLLSISPNPLGHNRYGFVVSRQVGSAAARNRVRRLLQEVVRALHSSMEAGFDVVVVARRDLVGKRYEDIFRTVQQMFRQAGLITEDSQ
jgi:ribonuclease P protein component